MTDKLPPERLKIARTITNLELRELATILECNYSYLSKMETGDRKVTKKARDWSDKIIKQFLAKAIKASNLELLERVEKECVYDDTDGVHVVVITRFNKKSFSKLKEEIEEQ